MVFFIFAIIFLLIALVAISTATFSSRNGGRDTGTALLTAVGSIILALIFGVGSAVYSQSVGQASVIINLGGTVAGSNYQPGFAMKAPWQQRVEWDLFSRSVTYAGNAQGAPSYTDGQVSGQQVTASVKGGAQTNFDFSAVYNLDGDQVEALYSEYRSQDRFTKQVIEPIILATARNVPSAYTPVEFRGEKRGEAQDKMLSELNAKLNPLGVEVTLVNLQNITYTEEVENSIKQVEVAQQKEEEARANLRATEVSAQAQVIEAEAEAKANLILSESLTDELLRLRWIEAINESGNAIVVPDGTTPFVQVNPVN